MLRIYRGQLIYYSFEISHFNEIGVKIPKIKSFSLSPLEKDILFLAHFPADDGASTIKMVSANKIPDGVTLGSKSFFQGDYMDYYWNSKGDMALVVNNTDIDKTGVSYYGRKMLYLFNKKGFYLNSITFFKI